MSIAVTDLTVRIGSRTILDRVSFAVPDGARVGVIGASGSGKSMTALALMGLTPEEAEVSGSIVLRGPDAGPGPDPVELVGLPDRARAAVRGSRIGMVFQEPATALDPLRRVGAQIAEPLRLHRPVPGPGGVPARRTSRSEAWSAAVALAASVGLPEPERLLRQYPHQLSGGQRQRICIAMALAGEPELLVADEPTTALDVTTEARILELFRGITAERGTGMLFITHDLAVLAQIADTAVVLDGGRVVDGGPVSALLGDPSHPTTRALVDAARATSRRTA